jgi:hypothetical protein
MMHPPRKNTSRLARGKIKTASCRKFNSALDGVSGSKMSATGANRRSLERNQLLILCVFLHFAHVKENVTQTKLQGRSASSRWNRMWPSGRDRIIHLNVGEIVKVEGLRHVQPAKWPNVLICFFAMEWLRLRISWRKTHRSTQNWILFKMMYRFFFNLCCKYYRVRKTQKSRENQGWFPSGLRRFAPVADIMAPLTPSNAELNFLQEAVLIFALASREVFFLGGVHHFGTPCICRRV